MHRQPTYPISNPISTQRIGESVSLAKPATGSLVPDSRDVASAVSVTAAVLVKASDAESGGMAVPFWRPE